jgi:hypothetical protein
MIAAGLPARAVHALLHHDPFAVVGDDEAVQIKIEAVLHCGAVDLGDEAACLRKRRAVDAGARADRDKLVRGPARVLAAAAAHLHAEFFFERREPALERADDARGDAGGMPVHAHHGAERLEPERVREPPQQLVAPVMVHDRLGHDRAEAGHAAGEPARHLPAVQRQIGASGALGHRLSWPPKSFVHVLYLKKRVGASIA